MARLYKIKGLVSIVKVFVVKFFFIDTVLMKGLTTICIEELVLALFQEELSLEEEFVPIEIITQLFHTAHVSGLISDYILENLIRDNITTITLRACMSLRDSGVRIIAERLPMLEVVDCMKFCFENCTTYNLS